ncbi:type IV inositol polyphosphate 5-phosphatase 9 isoform X2 [Daucus carota subsp. sativus]|uniref:type IV inositol polyphosphate 5-phosphatase 9 isoform X2 n=1 Tax=Daucus carota subsp. sativus TaxID=79200 RepID=UPI0007EF3B3F|nr:PREDICTED: type IV inositol polyphosphate 5-phosphatase 9-like isoform X2 [Daucus carota subsp. sativus]
MFLQFQLASVPVLGMVSHLLITFFYISSCPFSIYYNPSPLFSSKVVVHCLPSTSSSTMPRKIGEVMWPRLVASKILRKTLGSNNFVADFPSGFEDSSLELPSLDGASEYNPKSISTDHKESKNYKVFVSTWNVGGVSPTDDLDMEDFQDTQNNAPCDIYVFGFQEVVPLRAANILGYEEGKICMKWNSLIRKTLNKNTCGAEHDFRCLISKQMVGILISVWVRTDLLSFVRGPSVSCVGCGIMGCLGNKGSVSVRFRLHETSFCFVCSHLASGRRLGDEKLRNSNVADILSRTSFPRGPTLDFPKKILDHEISLPEDEIRLLVEKEEWDILLGNDQLKQETRDGEAFEGWHEGVINFAPTYKYNFNSDTYYGTIDGGRKDQKKRAPAWCDRIMWFGEGLKQHLYTRNESKLSDHRPVKAVFTTQVEVLHTVEGFQGFFLSQSFDFKPIKDDNGS